MKKFLETYQLLNKDNLQLLGDIYAQEIIFLDPAHRIKGLDQLTSYFAALYANVGSIQFDFKDTQHEQNKAYLQWEMNFSHPKLKKGKEIILPGVTYLEFDSAEKVIFHRDYFDLGAMLYEHIPLLGLAIQGVKKRLGK